MRPGHILCITALALAGCGPQGDVASTPALAVPAAFRALGTEPFWGMTVNGSDVRYSTPEIPESIARQVVRKGGGGAETVSGKLGDVPFRLTVRPESCSDGMSDRAYPFAVQLRVGDRDLQGCASAD